MKRIPKTSLLIFLLISCLSLTLKASIIDRLISKKKHHHKQQAQIGSNNVIDVPDDIGSSPVVRHADSERAALAKDRLYKPGSDNLVQGRGINIDKADLDKYFPNGVNLYLTDAQIQAQIDELKKQELYKNIGISSLILIIALIGWVYIKRRRRKLLVSNVQEKRQE